MWKLLLAVFVALLVVGCGEEAQKEVVEGEGEEKAAQTEAKDDPTVPIMIPCEACRKDLSKRSTTCPNCGHPTPASVVAYKEELKRAEEERKRNEPERKRLAEEARIKAEARRRAKLGTILWEFETGSDVQFSPAIESDGTVYVGSDDDKLYSIKTDSQGLANSPWPMRGQNARHTGRVMNK